MLNRDLNSDQFLIEHYISWGGDLEESEFPAINLDVEALLLKELPELETLHLKVDANILRVNVRLSACKIQPWAVELLMMKKKF